MKKVIKIKKESVKNEQVVSILSYFLIGIIWFFADDKIKKSKMAKHHVKQALNLFIFIIAIDIVLTIISFLDRIIDPIVNITFVILWVLGIIAAVNQEKKPIPLIGNFAKGYLKF